MILRQITYLEEDRGLTDPEASSLTHRNLKKAGVSEWEIGTSL